MTTPIQSTAAATATGAGIAAATGANASAADIENRFLTLLVSQLKNQDPLNPMDNAQLTTQLAQISTVSGIDKLNATMSSLATSLGASQYLQAGSLVGHDVLVAGSKLALAKGAAQGGFNLAQSADAVTITIKSASGAVVRTETLGALPAGVGAFTWDGQTDAGSAAVDGTYSFTVTATAGTGNVTADALMSGRVLGVIAGANGGATQVQVGSLGRFDLSQVLEIN
ncbi:MAG TPA: flagellar hook assembly protein FlgD [Casimicrobiaceae bacterium]